ncbi:MAG TPA: NAD(P)-dependent oxidoreductase [Candidatus Dormibacteraeota bacterium]|nr:NAD(P)-dependent oxidoreductase [Candidatus Dormibacteraeota bacterium]
MKILVVGDSFVPVSVFERGLAVLRGAHRLDFLQLDESQELVPVTASECSIREYLGTPAQLAARAADVDVLIVHGAPVTAEVLEAAPRLALICCARGGPVNVDVAAASARGIPVVNTPGKNAESVADQAIAFMIMLARGFPRAQRFLLDGGTLGESAFEGARFLGHDLGGHVLGLVGFGNVGRRVHKRAVAFGMRVIVYDPYVRAGELASTEQVPALADLLSTADFVSLHVRATAETENLFGSRQFAAMKPGAFFLNTARESLVDEEALDAALESGHLAGAALDVVRPRVGSGPHPLLRHENVVITPHIGGATHETLLRGVTMVAEDVARFAAGEPLRSVVNKEAAKA